MNPKILIVEDEPDNMETLSAYLQFKNYDIAKAVDGEEALKKVKKEKTDVVVLDLSIPKIDGWEVAKRIRNDQTTKDIIIIAFSAMALPHEMEKALSNGCDAFLPKPMSPDVLITEIEKIFNERK
ncbi:response regulator [bacterium]|nr:response regulator [bacterium]